MATNGCVLLQTLEKSLLWQRLRQMSEEGAVVEATVEQVRPAGLIVRVTGSDVTGFVPGSHISSVRARAPLAFPNIVLPALLSCMLRSLIYTSRAPDG